MKQDREQYLSQIYQTRLDEAGEQLIETFGFTDEEVEAIIYVKALDELVKSSEMADMNEYAERFPEEFGLRTMTTSSEAYLSAGRKMLDSIQLPRKKGGGSHNPEGGQLI